MKIDASPRTILTLAAVAGVGVLAVYLYRKGPATVARQAVAAVADAANAAVGETVNTVGEMIGIPRTNQTECEKAIAEGRTWDASFACPAGTFLRYLTGSTPPPLTTGDFARMDRGLQSTPYDPAYVPWESAPA
jgi:hypothetical protein